MDWIVENRQLIVAIISIAGVLIGGGVVFSKVRRNSQSQRVGRGGIGVQAGRDANLGRQAEPKGERGRDSDPSNR